MIFSDVTFHDEKIKYFSIDVLSKTKCVKSIFTTITDSKWKFGTHDSKENFLSLAKVFDIAEKDFCTTYQTHTNKIRVIKNDNRGEGVLQQTKITDYDGIITNEKKLLLCSFEADCVPVYFFDKEKKVIGIVHSGWKGTATIICHNAIDMMIKQFDCKAENIICVIGPCACKNCYEVGKELIENFKENFENDISKIFIPKKNLDKEKYNLDLALAIEITLLKCGILNSNIFSVEKCTIEENNLCSFRRTKSKTDHILTGIMLL